MVRITIINENEIREKYIFYVICVTSVNMLTCVFMTFDFCHAWCFAFNDGSSVFIQVNLYLFYK